MNNLNLKSIILTLLKLCFSDIQYLQKHWIKRRFSSFCLLHHLHPFLFHVICFACLLSFQFATLQRHLFVTQHS